MISHEVRIFRDIDGLQGQLAKSLSSLNVGVFIASDSNVSNSSARPILSVNHDNLYKSSAANLYLMVNRR